MGGAKGYIGEGLQPAGISGSRLLVDPRRFILPGARASGKLLWEVTEEEGLPRWSSALSRKTPAARLRSCAWACLHLHRCGTRRLERLERQVSVFWDRAPAEGWRKREVRLASAWPKRLRELSGWA